MSLLRAYPLDNDGNVLPDVEPLEVDLVGLSDSIDFDDECGMRDLRDNVQNWMDEHKIPGSRAEIRLDAETASPHALAVWELIADEFCTWEYLPYLVWAVAYADEYSIQSYQIPFAEFAWYIWRNDGNPEIAFDDFDPDDLNEDFQPGTIEQELREHFGSVSTEYDDDNETIDVDSRLLDCVDWDKLRTKVNWREFVFMGNTYTDKT